MPTLIHTRKNIISKLEQYLNIKNSENYVSELIESGSSDSWNEHQNKKQHINDMINDTKKIDYVAAGGIIMLVAVSMANNNDPFENILYGTTMGVGLGTILIHGKNTLKKRCEEKAVTDEELIKTDMRIDKIYEEAAKNGMEGTKVNRKYKRY
ncbi:MAG: hypothetical protein KJ906_03000 [Nanoarchaeota archaeon]|nr:hypothetical protein [Nanoarchaeota archaeon]